MFIKVVFLLWLLIFFSSCWCAEQSVALKDASSVPTVPPIELQALEDLYYATNGLDWNWDSIPGMQWNFTNANPCADDWQGIACTYVEGDEYSYVGAIYLSYYNLYGTLPDSISNFGNLSLLELNYNSLSGTIPITIGNLTTLEQLDVSFNYLIGAIPAGLYTLSKMKLLVLTSNELTGTLPDALCTMFNLEELVFNTIYLHSTIPACLGNLSTNLRALDLGYNRLTGTLPEELAQLTKLHELEVSSNQLYGTIPAFIGTFLDLDFLGLAANYYHGTIPLALCNLTELSLIFLDQNHLEGRIPDCLGSSAPKMVNFRVNNNMFTGTIPASLGNMPLLLYFAVGNNQLTGTVPDTLQNCSRLRLFFVGGNHLHGTIPAWLSIMPVYDLVMGNNNFTGTIPHEFSNLTRHLTRLFLGNNQLTGPIPEVLSYLPNLISLDLHHNHYTGTVPAFLGEALPLLRFLLLSENQLNGTIPSTLRALPLVFLDLSDNALTGIIPHVLSDVTDLLSLNLSYNRLVGSIPPELGTQNELRFISLSNNRLTGTIPAELSRLPSVFSLLLDNNQLHGTIPRQLGDLVTLTSLYLSNNRLQGTVPASFANFTHMSVLFLQNNQLSGPLTTVFNTVSNTTRYMRNLTAIQLSDNAFTGPLPEGLFQLPNLVSVAAVSNCFTGSLPLSICSAPQLATLALDGLQSAPACQQKMLPGSSFDSYLIGQPLGGGIPACMYQMPSIRTLHLSGNGLVDTLPDDVAISDTLTDLSLSHNQLYGSIPSAFQEHTWSKLDLSYNRLLGKLSHTISASMAANSSLQLEENRLSGRIPSGLNDVTDISILDSNLFSCATDRSDLPQHNPDVDEYQCGSDSLNYSLYAWLALVCVMMCTIGVLWYFRATVDSYVGVQQLWEHLDKWWNVDKLSRLGNFSRGSANVQAACTMGLLCCTYIAVVLLPLYGITSVFYGTYTDQYAWMLSAAFLAGTVPFCLELVCFAVLLVLLQLFMHWYKTGLSREQFLAGEVQNSGDTPQPAPSLRVPGYKRAVVYAIFITVNILLVAGVNVAYIYIALYQSESIVTLAQVLLSLFKVLFNSMCAPLILRWSIQLLFNAEQLATAIIEFSARESLQVQLFVMLVNNIAIPCTVVILISPNCFVNVFKPANPVSATFIYTGGCVELSNESDDNKGQLGCTEYLSSQLTTSYDPPFTFNYQCSSSIITYYAPAYVIMCMVASFVIPLSQLLLQQLHQRATVGTRWHRLLDSVIPRNLKPIENNVDGAAAGPASANVSAGLLLNPNQLFLSLLMFLGITVTFGAVFPPLAFALALTLVIMPSFAKLKIGRFLQQAVELECVQYIDAVNEECKGIASVEVLQYCLRMIFVFAWLFYALFLFDTLGGAVGFHKSFWVLIVMPLIPACMYLAFVLHNMHTAWWVGPSKTPDDRDTIEMGGVSTEILSPMTSQAIGGPFKAEK